VEDKIAKPYMERLIIENKNLKNANAVFAKKNSELIRDAPMLKICREKIEDLNKLTRELIDDKDVLVSEKDKLRERIEKLKVEVEKVYSRYDILDL